MPNEEILLEVEDLYTNFYTYQGVVKALDGVSFNIKRGETFGLVGETGCGKSVTANCILRLIPQPPGKIESGHIFIMMPEAEATRRTALKEEVASMTARNDPSEAKKLAEAKAELEKIERSYDLLLKSDAFMRKIRGKYVSIIFQEPMSALNPVFTAGDQIAEILLLHEKKELAQAVLKNSEAEIKAIDNFHRVGFTKTVKGEFQCSKCQALMAGLPETCPQCGGSFHSKPFIKLRKLEMIWNKRFYNRMLKKPDSFSLRMASKIPILRSFEKRIKAEALDRAERMLRLVRIPDPHNVVSSYPHELSGGMQQRVMIAMALACKPQLLIADEPTTALDVTIQAQILKLMRDLQEEMGTSILIITHNLGVVAETCQRVGVMYAGLMAEIGSVEEIFKEPLHPYTQGLMNAIPNVTSTTGRLETIEGNVPNLITPPPGCRFNPRCPYAMEICKREKPPMIEIKPGHLTTCHLYTKVSQ